MEIFRGNSVLALSTLVASFGVLGLLFLSFLDYLRPNRTLHVYGNYRENHNRTTLWVPSEILNSTRYTNESRPYPIDESKRSSPTQSLSSVLTRSSTVSASSVSTASASASASASKSALSTQTAVRSAANSASFSSVDCLRSTANGFFDSSLSWKWDADVLNACHYRAFTVDEAIALVSHKTVAVLGDSHTRYFISSMVKTLSRGVESVEGSVKRNGVWWDGPDGSRFIWPHSSTMADVLTNDLKEFTTNPEYGIIDADVWVINCAHWDASEFPSMKLPDGTVRHGGFETFKSFFPQVVDFIKGIAARVLPSGRHPLIIWQTATRIFRSLYDTIPLDVQQSRFGSLRRPEIVEEIFHFVDQSGIYNSGGVAAVLDLHKVSSQRIDWVRSPLAPGEACCPDHLDVVHFKDDLFDLGLTFLLNVISIYFDSHSLQSPLPMISGTLSPQEIATQSNIMRYGMAPRFAVVVQGRARRSYSLALASFGGRPSLRLNTTRSSSQFGADDRVDNDLFDPSAYIRVFSTWDSEFAEDGARKLLEDYSDAGFHVIINQRDSVSFVGSKTDGTEGGNVNLQIGSTLPALLYSKAQGATHALKIRGDMLVTNPSFFLNSIIGDFPSQLSTFFWCGFFTDWAVAGPIDEVIQYFSSVQKRGDPRFAEQFLGESYASSKNWSMSQTCRYVKFWIPSMPNGLVLWGPDLHDVKKILLDLMAGLNHTDMCSYLPIHPFSYIPDGNHEVIP
jgi:hypothetical protein